MPNKKNLLMCAAILLFTPIYAFIVINSHVSSKRSIKIVKTLAMICFNTHKFAWFKQKKQEIVE